jgi:hypothetical protein
MAVKKERSPLLRSTSNTESPNSILSIIIEIVCLVFVSFVTVLAFIINTFSAIGDPATFGFRNSTGNISDLYSTLITPDYWTFSIWSVIYVWQAIWLLYGWTFVFRPQFKKTITPLAYLVYSIANIGNIIWIYLWGNSFPEAAFPFLIIITIALWSTISIQVFYLYRIASKPPTKYLTAFKIDFYITQIVVVNGVVIYATWCSIATLINLSIVLQYFINVEDITTGIIALVILTIELGVYFTLENTILDRFLRFVFMTYVVVIWALLGVLSRNYYEDPNLAPIATSIYTLVLVCISVLMLVTRIILCVVFFLFRSTVITRLVSFKLKA